MEIINNIQWFIKCQPKTAINKITYNNINKTELDTIIFDDSIKENIKLSFPLHDNYLFFVKREIERPVTVKKILTFMEISVFVNLEKVFFQKLYLNIKKK